MRSKERASGTVKLISKVMPTTRKLYIGLSKKFNALFIQLKMGVISFNNFLFRYRVPTVFSLRYAYNSAAMTVYHILLNCPIWTEPYRELLDAFYLKDLCKLFNN